jgi:[acyl-carrier-protein] S-malonyltransferase
MQEAQQKMILEISNHQILSTTVPVIMNVSAMPTTSAFEVKDNLQNQITHSVRWRETMNFALNNKLEIVEIGTGNVLSNLAKRANYPFNITNISDADSLNKFLTNYSQ